MADFGPQLTPPKICLCPALQQIGMGHINFQRGLSNAQNQPPLACSPAYVTVTGSFQVCVPVVASFCNTEASKFPVPAHIPN
eukprot:1139379-Pelagomonas_calceolata.AAC.3